jgi:hypothetical protein
MRATVTVSCAATETGAPDLAAELGLQAATGLASACRYRALDAAQLGLHVRLERAGNRGRKLQV